jgi:tyrosine-protein kinase Etk/Wzc
VGHGQQRPARADHLSSSEVGCEGSKGSNGKDLPSSGKDDIVLANMRQTPHVTPEPSAATPGPTPLDPGNERTASLPINAGTEAAVDPVDLLIVLGRHRRMLLLWPLLAAIVAAVVSLLLPQTFTGVTRIMPPQAQSSAASMLSQLGGLGGLGGLAGMAGGALGIKNPSDLCIGMLKSNAVADVLIERFRLKDVYRDEYLADARKDLAANSQFEMEKSGLIVIEVDARDRRLAADMANAYVEQLHQLTSTLAVTEAAQRRLFFERQLQLTK